MLYTCFSSDPEIFASCGDAVVSAIGPVGIFAVAVIVCAVIASVASRSI